MSVINKSLKLSKLYGSSSHKIQHSKIYPPNIAQGLGLLLITDEPFLAPLGVVITGKHEAEDSKTTKDKYSKERESKEVEGAEACGGSGSDACNHKDGCDGDDVVTIREANATDKD